MYALLIYFLVNLGSMGIGEDLFYKWCAPSEEIVHSLYLSKQFLFEIWNNEYEFFFLKNTFLSTCWFILVFDSTIRIYEHTVNSKTLQRYFAELPCLHKVYWNSHKNCLMSKLPLIHWTTNTASLCDVSINRKGETILQQHCKIFFKGTYTLCLLDWPFESCSLDHDTE